ncbi:phage baseplate assembly protein V [Herbaspirillum seropedicae]|uniref:Bacteriophage baseplate assembly (GpV) protein n=1 Tax=Herbaspirillum seropedicae (strain SmR1) TaxID=757424 RepID=D8IV20_HERSS|nr:phage baseplate assembly protein V [Herbaspirillum seropedicae]ADJ61739.1 bacteriophage baseplate assembly (gpV) protein [Herbaspirillum seropedicae SmR1]UMU19853.1 phage baseplate assembly protein V [Herbaspirillum seropedicae]
MTALGVSYKQGVVCASKPGFARVRFDDMEGLQSAWLPVVHPKTLQDQVLWTLDVGEHVACLMDGHMEDGCILGALYSSASPPPSDSPDKLRLQFKDGGHLEYDRSSGAMQVLCKGAVSVEAAGAVTVKAPSVLLDTPQATCTGTLTVQGQLTYQGGMAGSGGGASAAVIRGNVSVQGNVQASGTVMDAGGNSNHHSH